MLEVEAQFLQFQGGHLGLGDLFLDSGRPAWQGAGVARNGVWSGEDDRRFREAAFAWLGERGAAPVMTRAELEGFVFEGQRIPLVDRNRGIRRPAGFRGAVSIMTTYSATEADAPYEDVAGADGFLRYKYRGDDPSQGDNRAEHFGDFGGRPFEDVAEDEDCALAGWEELHGGDEGEAEAAAVEQDRGGVVLGRVTIGAPNPRWHR